MFSAGNIVSSNTCKRCKLEYPTRQNKCHHCTGLSDDKAAQLANSYYSELHKSNRKLRRTMLIAILVVTNILMIGFMLI